MLNLGQNLDKNFGKLAKHETEPTAEKNPQYEIHYYYVVKEERWLPKVLNWLAVFFSGIAVGCILKGFN